MKGMVQTNEMQYLRRVKGFTRLERIGNKHIRKQLETESIQKRVED